MLSRARAFSGCLFGNLCKTQFFELKNYDFLPKWRKKIAVSFLIQVSFNSGPICGHPRTPGQVLEITTQAPVWLKFWDAFFFRVYVHPLVLVKFKGLKFVFSLKGGSKFEYTKTWPSNSAANLATHFSLRNRGIWERFFYYLVKFSRIREIFKILQNRIKSRNK